MGTEEGALLLLRRVKYIAEDALLEAASEAEQATAKEIATQLDGLPLALDQAAAYVDETACGLSGYLRLYPVTTLRHCCGVVGRWLPIIPTRWLLPWALSFENIEKGNPAAAELLRFCASYIPMRSPKKCSARLPRNSGRCWVR